MNSDPNSLGADAAVSVEPTPSEFNWRGWAKRLLVCNPFFLCSAALLLFGVNQLVNDPGFLGDEVHNLLFNFFALQLYEVLVVVTALVLARRRVWYDSALLAVMENGLVLVPFMLISQATMQNEGMTLAWTLTFSGGVLAAARFGALKRWYRQFNLPWRALLLGGVILAANVALPLVFRPRMELDLEDWSVPNLFLWYVAVPLIVAGANLLPRPMRYGGTNPERHWLPLFNYALWAIGSAVHVWSIAHICGFPLEWNHLAPTICVAAWTLWRRLTDCVVNPTPRWQAALLMLAAGAPLLVFAVPELMLVMVALNLGGFLALGFWGRGGTRAIAQQMAFVTMALVFAAMPSEWGQAVLDGYQREHGVAFGGTLYLALLALRSARPEAGLLGAIAAGIDAGWLAPRHGFSVGLQSGAVFLLLHSLRWSDWEHAGAKSLRWLAAGIWSIHAVTWTSTGGWWSVGMTAGGAMLVAAGWLVAWKLRQERGPWVIPGAAIVTVLAGPGNSLLRFGSDGLLAMVGSLALFGVGFAVAWTRHRWERREDPRHDG